MLTTATASIFRGDSLGPFIVRRIIVLRNKGGVIANNTCYTIFVKSCIIHTLDCVTPPKNRTV